MQFKDWYNEPLEIPSSVMNLPGSLSWFFGLAIWVTSFEWMRRNYFEVSTICSAPVLSGRNAAQYHVEESHSNICPSGLGAWMTAA